MNGVLGWKKTVKDLRFKIIWIIVLVAGCLMAVLLGKSPTELILVAQAANAILLPIMAFFVMYVANGKSLASGATMRSPTSAASSSSASRCSCAGAICPAS